MTEATGDSQKPTITYTIDLSELFNLSRPQISDILIKRLDESIGESAPTSKRSTEEKIADLCKVLRQKPGGRPTKPERQETPK